MKTVILALRRQRLQKQYFSSKTVPSDLSDSRDRREKDLDADSSENVTPRGLRGMPDFFGDDCRKIRYVEEIMQKSALLHGFREARLPIVEKLSVFQRSLGESSDVVSKEMFTFPDRFQRQVSLRPEGTAGRTCRSFCFKAISQIFLSLPGTAQVSCERF